MSSGPFLCYKELIPPTAVLCSSFFISGGYTYLITGSATVLNVYLVHQSSTKKNEKREKDAAEEKISQLLQVATLNINGFPHDICSVDVSHGEDLVQTSQHLLVSLDKGKLVLVVFDSVYCTLELIRMYNVEDGAIGESAYQRSDVGIRACYPGMGSNPFIAIDSCSGVVCMNINAFEVFFMSYRNSLYQIKPFTFPVSSIGCTGAILDICFISGYGRPALAILHDSQALPIGHLAKVAHTVSVTVVSVDMDSQVCTPLWRQKKLPHDACRLVQMSSCHSISGGVLLITNNALVFVTEESVFGLACNGFASVSVDEHIPLVPWPLEEAVELHSSKWREVLPGCFVGCLVGGKLVMLHIESSAAHAVLGEGCVYYDVDIIGKCVDVSSFSTVEKSAEELHGSDCKSMTWFFGSSMRNCLLMDVEMKLTAVESKRKNVSEAGSKFGDGTFYLATSTDEFIQNTIPYLPNNMSQPSQANGTPFMVRISSDSSAANPQNSNTQSSKRQRLSTSSPSTSDVEVKNEATSRARDEYYSLYASSYQADVSRKWSFPQVKIKIVDYIEVLGPVLSGRFYSGNEESLCSSKVVNWDRSSSEDRTKSSAAAYIVDREARDTLEVTCGIGDSASLLRITKGVHMSKLASQNFTHVTHSCTLPFKYNVSKEDLKQGTFFFLSEIRNASGFNRRRLFRANGSQEASKESSKIVIATEECSPGREGDVAVQMEELKGEANAFCVEQLTVSVGLVRENIAVQACSQCLRVVQITPDYSNIKFSVELLALQDVLMEEEIDMGGFGGKTDEYILTADSCLSGWVIALSSRLILYLYQYDDANEMLMLRHTINSTLDFDRETLLFNPGSTPSEDNDDDESSAQSLGNIVTASLYVGRLGIRNNSELPKPVSKTNEALSSSLPNFEKCNEERYLYGSVLQDEQSNGVLMTQEEEVQASSAGACSQPEEPKLCDAGTYIIIADRSGRVSIVQVSVETSAVSTSSPDDEDSSLFTPKRVFQSIPLGALHDNISLGNDSADLSSTVKAPPKRYVTAVSLVRIGCGDDEKELECNAEAPICLVTVFNTADVIVYKAITAKPGFNADIICFQKVGHSLVTRRKRTRVMSRLKRNLGSDLGSLSASQSMLSIAKDSQDRRALVISGARPLLVSNVRGLIQVLPLCLPELPYAGVGIHVSNYFSTGLTRGLSVLWREEKIEGTANSCPGGGAAITSLTTLGLYIANAGATRLPGSAASVIRTHVGRTVHSVCEIVQNKTDDATQKALLKTKTFAMLCSEKVCKKWNGSVFTAEEKAEEEGTYDRFFKNLDSFCEPSGDIGPPPLIEEDEYSISIIQAGGAIVDTYRFAPGETVLDMTVVYLDAESPEATPSTVPNLTTAPIPKKKAFVVACTSIDDKHGEDTQGEGRLLLFSLDYAMYQEDQDNAQQQQADDGEVNVKKESSEEGDATDSLMGKRETNPISSPNGVLKETESLSSEGVSVMPTTAQARFLGSIKPKLRLVWTGPGPGSVVTQFRNYVLATVGATLYLYLLIPDKMELEQIAFFFAQFFISTVSTMKDYILIGDAFQSVQFVIWREEDRSLTLLAKDYDKSACVAASYVLDGDSLSFVVSDDEANLQLLRFNPKVIESKKGFRLLSVAGFHLGSTITSLIPHRTLESPIRLLSSGGTASKPKLPPPPPPPPPHGRGVTMAPRPPPPPPPAAPPPPSTRRSMDSTAAAISSITLGARFDKNCSRRSSLIVGTADGGMGILSPIDERVHRTLSLLQQIMSTTVPSCCGLNPWQFRLLKCTRQRLENTKGILDGNLLWQYANLEESLQDELAFAMGTSADTILDCLQEIDVLNSFF